MNRRSIRIWFVVIYLALAAFQVGNAIVSHGHVLAFVGAGAWAVLAVLFGVLTLWIARRMPVKMKRLRREIRTRYPEDWA